MKGNNLAAVIDAIGAVKAKIADLEAQEKSLRDEIAAMGDGAYDGTLFRATVSTAERDTLDMAAVRAHLSRQFIAAHTITKAVTTVKVVARK